MDIGGKSRQKQQIETHKEVTGREGTTSQLCLAAAPRYLQVGVQVEDLGQTSAGEPWRWRTALQSGRGTDGHLL